MLSPRKLIPCIVGAIVLLASPFLLSWAGFFAWSPINCWHYDVDIHSGRIRYTRQFAFLQISQRIDESTLSAALDPKEVRVSGPDWRRTLTFSPRIHNSPHYIFHGALSQIRQLEATWELGVFTPAARRQSAKRLLELWQRGQTDDAAEPYLRAITEIALQRSTQHQTTDATDLATAE